MILYQRQILLCRIVLYEYALADTLYPPADTLYSPADTLYLVADTFVFAGRYGTILSYLPDSIVPAGDTLFSLADTFCPLADTCIIPTGKKARSLHQKLVHYDYFSIVGD